MIISVPVVKLESSAARKATAPEISLTWARRPLMALRPQSAVGNPDGSYQLFRIGGAVAGRNVHAAMLEAARLCRAI